jgi:hypothetical protein
VELYNYDGFDRMIRSNVNGEVANHIKAVKLRRAAVLFLNYFQNGNSCGGLQFALAEDVLYMFADGRNIDIE